MKKTKMAQKVFVDFRSENKPFIHPDKIVFGVLENYKYSAKHMISDYFQVQNATHIVFILPREMEERKKEKILECLQKENKACFSSKTYSFYDDENIFKIFPELNLQQEENINFLTCKLKHLFIFILFMETGVQTPLSMRVQRDGTIRLSGS